MLRLDDNYLWDSWVADDGDLYHLFFLKAPRSLGSPGLPLDPIPVKLDDEGYLVAS